ncbi:hypothetical protein [Gordonia terrae]|uniref:hypothetical protein n=1 Tax=Gordonia terrae TaxID=2055 RepID=UPI003F6B8293
MTNTTSVIRVVREGVGILHNELATVARHLGADGKADVEEYERRAAEAEKVYRHFRNLATACRTFGRLGTLEEGQDLADYLITEGWRPPAYIPVEKVDSDHDEVPVTESKPAEPGRVTDRQISDARMTLWRHNNGFSVTEGELALALARALSALEEARQ